MTLLFILLGIGSISIVGFVLLRVPTELSQAGVSFWCLVLLLCFMGMLWALSHFYR
jgi:hypothetical protein